MKVRTAPREKHDVTYVIPRIEGVLAVLATRRSSDEHYYPSKLNLTIEHIEPGETPRQAAIRGIREELGAELNPNLLKRLGRSRVVDRENGLSINIRGIYVAPISLEHSERMVEREGEAERGSKMQLGLPQLKVLVGEGKFSFVDTHVLGALGMADRVLI